MNNNIRRTVILVLLSFFGLSAVFCFAAGAAAELKITLLRDKALQLSYTFAGKPYPAVILTPVPASGMAGKITVKEASAGKIVCTTADGRSSFIIQKDAKSGYLQFTDFKHIKSLRFQFQSRALVLPDKRCEDLVIYPENWQHKQVTVPSDNHLLLNMLDNGNAVLACIWNNQQSKLTELKTDREFTGLELQPAAGEHFVLGINTGRHIWKRITQKLSRKAAIVEWQPPFTAVWHIVLKRGDSDIFSESNQCDTWPLVDLGGHLKSGWLGVFLQDVDGRTFATNLGTINWPFYIKNGKTWLLLPKYRNYNNSYNKTWQPLIYPVASAENQPSLNLLYDIAGRVLDKKIANSLYNIHDPGDTFAATCVQTAKIEKIFYREAEAKQAEKIKWHCRSMNNFIALYVRRDQQYLVWNKKVMAQVTEFGSTYPHYQTLMTSLQRDLFQLQRRYAESRGRVKTPAYFQTLTAKLSRLTTVDHDQEEKYNRCREICRAIRVIGGSQDQLTGEMHAIIKAFRMRVTELLMQSPPPGLKNLLGQLRQEAAAVIHKHFEMDGK